MNEIKPTLIYDEQCTLCKRFKQGLQILDSKNQIEYLDANEDATYQQFAILDKEECLKVVHLVLASGDIVTGGDVITELVKTFPAAEKLSWLIESDMGKKVNNYFYKKMEQLRRSALQGCSRCDKH